MADIKYTKSQQQVIDTRDTNLLVSASAGSGKTRVLVDRVIKRITEEGIGVDQLLIVTFTKAAAKEMKDRIHKSLERKITETTGENRRRLMHQLSLLPVANISTLDAFCQQIIERYYYIIDLDPVFRLLADKTEGILLRDQVWQDVRETLYENDEDGSFKRLTANFSNDRNDDGLTDLVNRVYFYANAKPNPAQWLQQLADPYVINGTLNDSDLYRKQILPLIQNRVEQAIKDLGYALEKANQAEFPKLAELCETEMASLRATQDQLPDLKWDEVRETLFVKRSTSPRVTKKDDVPELKKEAQEARKAALAVIDELQDTYLALNEAITTEVMQQSHAIVTKLATTVQAFSDAYQQEKLRQHVLDFSDLEHYALEILSADTEQGKAVREQLRDRYEEIMVDEYQDTNALQEAILQTITRHEPGNLFMVGDVKQSIYRFRLADPSLFVGKFNHFGEDPQAGKDIQLAENFRSIKNVDDFTNLIFTQLMNQELGEMDYTGGAKLVFGASYYPDGYTPATELLIYEDQQTNVMTEQNEDEPIDATFKIDDKVRGQVAMVGQRILEMQANGTEIFDRETGEMRPVAFKDFALLTPTKNNNLVITELFAQMGIPVLVNDAQNYFKTTEIQIMMALLSLIDNPYQDIPLAAVLRSPIVGLDENQLAYLRVTDKTGDYFQAVLQFHDTYQSGNPYGDAIFPKIDRFLKQLTIFKDVAKQNQLVELIWRIYQETGFLDYVAGMPAGKQRQANLHALYERAAVYEKSNFKGLFQFVQFIQRMQSEDEDLAEAPTEVSDDAVRVMTIHGSKGLEFPVVFLMDMSHQFNMSDTKGDAVLNDKLGIGITYFDEHRRAKFDSLQKNAGQ
ncbi:helicase-exonuclease AddAB subunit AddA [Secundilactobacillus oryzae]|uniref:helicase-exonuclease AddAB subunit AddA n=1 Tax=Secundilactobacillus oryzae TaxID=1202668 RepID=UPI000A3F856F|nr:helicase-exonuclease AddAB subunit AddA [Secundilactobacillus oryzae]